MTVNIHDNGLSIALESVQTTSEAMRRFIAAIASNGVFDDYENELAVTESSPTAMTVDVDTGAVIIGPSGQHAFGAVSASATLTIANNSSGSARVDRIIAELDLSQSAGNDTLKIRVLQGTPGAGAPSLTQSSTVYQISLAQIAVANGETEITNSEITDERNLVVPLVDEFTSAYKASDETINSDDTLSADSDLSISVEANATYEVEGFIHFTTSSTPGFKMELRGPSGSTIQALAGTAEGGTTDGGTHLDGSGEEQINVATFTAQGVSIKGYIIVSTTSGNLEVHWAQNSSNAADTTVKAGSWLRVKKVS